MRPLMIGLAAAIMCGDAMFSPLAAQGDELLLRQPRLRIGVADGHENYLLFGAQQAQRMTDGRIVVANFGSSQFRIYDPNGRHVRNVGRRGGGPGEFTGLQQIGVIRGDTIMAYDVLNGRVSVFSPAGDFVRSHTVQPFANNVLPRAAGFTSSGTMLVHTDFGRVFIPGEHRDTITFGLIDAAGAETATIGRFPGEESFILAVPNRALRRTVIFGRDTHAAARGGRFVVGSSDSFRFDVFDEAGRRLRSHTEERPPRRVQRAHIRAANDVWLSRMRADMRGDVERRIGEFPHRETFPAYEALLVGTDGTVWVQEYAVPGQPERRWTVYAADGTRLRQVRAPAPIRIVDAGMDYVLAWLRDDDDVESILLFDLPPVPSRR